MFFFVTETVLKLSSNLEISLIGQEIILLDTRNSVNTHKQAVHFMASEKPPFRPLT